jgi:hypothetical protein
MQHHQFMFLKASHKGNWRLNVPKYPSSIGNDQGPMQTQMEIHKLQNNETLEDAFTERNI